MLTLQDIATVFERRGHEQYSGEPVTQLEHALLFSSGLMGEGVPGEHLPGGTPLQLDAKRCLCAAIPSLQHLLARAQRCSLT